MPGDTNSGDVGRGGHRRTLSFVHFAALVIIVALVSTSAVPFPDLAFAFLSVPYLFLLSSLAFPKITTTTTTSPSPPPSFTRNKPIFSAYVAVASLLGLLLPIAYISHGLLSSSSSSSSSSGSKFNNNALAAAAPHLFLLATQLVLKGAAAVTGFSLPAFAAVPVAYNSRRMFALADWVRRETTTPAGPGESTLQVFAGRALASANLLFWAFNLFGFLLPVYLPWALKTHYSAHYKEDDFKGQDIKKE